MWKYKFVMANSRTASSRSGFYHSVFNPMLTQIRKTNSFELMLGNLRTTIDSQISKIPNSIRNYDRYRMSGDALERFAYQTRVALSHW